MAESWLLGGVRGGSPSGLSGSDSSYSRFSLLDLDPGEIYFQDFSVSLTFKDGPARTEIFKRSSTPQSKGRLKICSKSFLFDPVDVGRPIIKFPLRYVVSVDEFMPTSASSSSSSSSWTTGGKAGSSIILKAKTTVEMKEQNIVGPFVFRKHDQASKEGAESFLITFHYVNVEVALPLMSSLLSASRTSFSEQSEIVESIQSCQAEVKFNRNWLDNAFDSILLELKAERISPLIVNPGRVVLTGSKLYFQAFNNVEPFPCLQLTLRDISQIVKRRYLLRHVGLEIACRAPTSGGGVTNFADGAGSGIGLLSTPKRSAAFATSALTHLYLVCENRESRDSLYDLILSRDGVAPEGDAQQAMTLKWQNGVITNFDYLMELNNLANRSMSDLTQYPVFPWVLRDYTSAELDLDDPSVYRDLTKPIGALNQERLDRLKQRFQDMPEPRFLYGSHYSTPGFVLFYLVRAAPELMLCLQNGRFDLPDRMFNGIAEAWNNVLTNNSDFKELVPEFYMTANRGDEGVGHAPTPISPLGGLGGKFLTNYREIDFGTRQATGKSVQEVELPPWARTHDDFVLKMREALESDYVSNNLHHWIDLVFGYKQRGPTSVAADNVFHYLTYEGSVDIEAEMDPGQRAAFEAQILEFGQTPTQLFTSPHPQRPSTFDAVSAAGTVSNAASSDPAERIPTEASGRPRGFSGFVNAAEEEKAAPEIPLNELLSPPIGLDKVHRDAISGVALNRNGERVVTVSRDGFLKVHCLRKFIQLVSFSISGMPLTCMQLLPNGESALIGSSDNNVYLFNLVQCVSTQPMDYAHDDSITDLCWRKDVLLTCSSDCSAKLWSFPWNPMYGNHPDVVLLAILDHEHPVQAGALTEEADIVATGTDTGDIYLWNTDDPASPLSILDELHSSPITRLCFDPLSVHRAMKLASASQDGVISVVDVSTGTQVFVTHQSGSKGQSELNYIVWASDNDRTNLHQVGDGGMRAKSPTSGDDTVAPPPACSREPPILGGLYGGKESGELDVWDMVRGNRREKLSYNENPISCLDVAGGVGIAAGCDNGTVVLWLLRKSEALNDT